MFQALRKFPFFILIVMAFSIGMLLPAAIAWQYQQKEVLNAFLRSGIFLFVISVFIGMLLMNRRTRGDYRDHLVSLALTFTILPMILSAPILQSIPEWNFAQASFEMLASLTTTGSTLIEFPFGRMLPILVWSALVAWMGAFVMLLIIFAVFEPSQIGGFELVRDLQNHRISRQTGGNTGHSDRLTHYFILLAPPYALATFFLALGLAFSGERLVFALVHAFSIISTSGIGPFDSLANSKMNWFGEFLIVLFLGLAFSRNYMLSLAQGRMPRPDFKDPELRTAVFVLMLSTIILFLWVSIVQPSTQPLEWVQKLWGGFFMSISFLSTTGIAGGYWNLTLEWGAATPAMVMLAGLAILGGGVATTAGGIKLLRIYAIFRLSRREVERLLDPHSIAASGFAGRQLRRQGGINAFVFLMLFMAGISVLCLSLTFVGFEFEEALVHAIASITNCGPIVNLFPEYHSPYANYSNAALSIMSAGMIFGRVEVFVLIALFNPSFWLEIRGLKRL